MKYTLILHEDTFTTLSKIILRLYHIFKERKHKPKYFCGHYIWIKFRSNVSAIGLLVQQHSPRQLNHLPDPPGIPQLIGNYTKVGLRELAG